MFGLNFRSNWALRKRWKSTRRRNSFFVAPITIFSFYFWIDKIWIAIRIDERYKRVSQELLNVTEQSWLCDRFITLKDFCFEFLNGWKTEVFVWRKEKTLFQILFQALLAHNSSLLNFFAKGVPLSLNF